MYGKAKFVLAITSPALCGVLVYPFFHEFVHAAPASKRPAKTAAEAAALDQNQTSSES